MSAEKDRLQAEIHESMKAGQKVRLATLRLLSSSVKNREIELRRELTSEEFIDVVPREARRRKESIDAFAEAGREDRADVEREELAVLQTYLPEALTAEELAAIIDEAIATTGATEAKDMGAVMREVMTKTRGRADGKAVSEAVRARLA
ncbi:MAG: GatB/YqeY domain-containing protein [Actinobacteria bacterium]|nr:GatB/YqeY domain-containing protein [Actinomycetota bacterium]